MEGTVPCLPAPETAPPLHVVPNLFPWGRRESGRRNGLNERKGYEMRSEEERSESMNIAIIEGYTTSKQIENPVDRCYARETLLLNSRKHGRVVRWEYPKQPRRNCMLFVDRDGYLRYAARILFKMGLLDHDFRRGPHIRYDGNDNFDSEFCERLKTPEVYHFGWDR